MEALTIAIQCYDCNYYNRQYLGTEGFEYRITEFTSFSEAFDHKVENPNHYMTFVIHEEKSE